MEKLVHFRNLPPEELFSYVRMKIVSNSANLKMKPIDLDPGTTVGRFLVVARDGDSRA